MYFYACPYCEPCAKARLAKIKVMSERACKYNKEDEDCEEKHKCKEVMKCKKCKEEWAFDWRFLKKQKRKIKDG